MSPIPVVRLQVNLFIFYKKDNLFKLYVHFDKIQITDAQLCQQAKQFIL